MNGPTGPGFPHGPTGPKGPSNHHDHLQSQPLEDPRVTSTAEAEKKIKDFFKSANKARHGLQVECPFCGAAMVVRLRGRDDRAFLGCTKYPRCSGSWDIPDEAQHESKNWERLMMTPQHVGSMLPRSGPQKALPVEKGVWRRYAANKSIQGMGISIQEGDRFDFDGETLLYRGVGYSFPPMKGAVDVGWFTYLGPSDIEMIEAYQIREGKKKMSKEAMDVVEEEAPARSQSIKSRLARSAMKAPYRVARMRALTEGRKAILGALRNRVQPASYDLVEAFLDTDSGQGAILGLIGIAGPYAPKIGKNKHVQAVCDEFLDEGVAKGANEVFGLLGLILEPVLKSVMSSLPPVSEIADKVVPKRRKKRVATDVRVKKSDEAPPEEEEEVVEPRRKSALRAL